MSQAFHPQQQLPQQPLPVARAFATASEVIEVTPISDGHIHDTYRCACRDGALSILQRINTAVFVDPAAVMRNIVIVLSAANAGHRAIRLPALIGASQPDAALPVVRRPDGSWWRMWHAIPGAVSAPIPARPREANACGRGFGAFLAFTRELEPKRLTETIPRFHDIERRLGELADAIRLDPAGRLSGVTREVGLVEERASRMTSYFRSLGRIAPRVTHNDTKFNNILLDAQSGEPRAVIDLDTVMAGYAAYDFGDGARTGAATAAEDTGEPQLMGLNRESFRAYADGFLEEASLSADELATLPQATAYMTFIMAVRFLTDYLAGDRYYHVDDPEHNLRRARAQLSLVLALEADADQIRAVFP